ncbi:MAG: hypothetical protein WBF93_15340, partial [Pirellulales bacterium]
IEDRGFRERCWEVLQIMLADQRQAWDMQPDGTYIQRQPKGDDPLDSTAVGTHQLLMERTRSRNDAGPQ